MTTTRPRTQLRRLALVATVSGALTLGAAVPAGADMPFISKIRLKESFPAFHGLVKSDSDGCVANREVRLFKERRNGEDKVLGKTRTMADGKWEILVDPLKSGVYYAKVNQAGTEETGITCLPDTSKKAVVD
jgi:hypothetical protein